MVLPNWLMLREKRHMAVLLGRYGTQRTSSTPPFLAPGASCPLYPGWVRVVEYMEVR